MKRIFLAIALIAVSACGPTAEDVAGNAKRMFIETLATDKNLKDLSLRVIDLKAVEVGKNQYKGFAEVATKRGTMIQVVLEITADRENIMWEAAPGAFVVAFQEQAQDEARKAREALAATPTVQTNIASGKYLPPDRVSWAVQVASISESQKALALADALSKANYNAFIKTSAGVNRIYIGPFNTKDEADAARYMASQSKLNGFVVKYKPD